MSFQVALIMHSRNTRCIQFEERNKEDERCRAIFKYALDHVPKHLAGDLYQEFVNFEKQVCLVCCVAVVCLFVFRASQIIRFK